MGFAGSWIAVKCERAAALAKLEVEEGAELDGDFVPRQLAVGELADGWLLFLTPDLEEAFSPGLVSLSELGPAVGCAVEEHVMFHETRGFEAGREIWRVTHDSEKGIFDLQTAGAVPASFEALRRKYVEAQESEGGEDADVDLICEVPLEIAAQICGYKHDGAGWPESFTALNRPGSEPPKRRGVLQRLFGGR